jgi:hypothetical protein
MLIQFENRATPRPRDRRVGGAQLPARFEHTAGLKLIQAISTSDKLGRDHAT